MTNLADLLQRTGQQHFRVELTVSRCRIWPTFRSFELAVVCWKRLVGCGGTNTPRTKDRMWQIRTTISQSQD